MLNGTGLRRDGAIDDDCVSDRVAAVRSCNRIGPGFVDKTVRACGGRPWVGVATIHDLMERCPTWMPDEGLVRRWADRTLAEPDPGWRGARGGRPTKDERGAVALLLRKAGLA